MADRPKSSRIPVVLIMTALGLLVHGLVTRNAGLDFDAAVVELVDGDADKPERQVLLQIVAEQGVSLAAERKDSRPAVLAFVAQLLLARTGGEAGTCSVIFDDPWAKKSAFVPGGSGADLAESVEGLCLGEDRIRHLLLGYRAANRGELGEARQRLDWAQSSARLWGHGACEELAAAAIKNL